MKVIPPGVLAERWRRKWILAAGMAFKAAGYLVWAPGGGFAGAALGFVCWGAQGSFPPRPPRGAWPLRRVRPRRREGRLFDVLGHRPLPGRGRHRLQLEPPSSPSFSRPSPAWRPPASRFVFPNRPGRGRTGALVDSREALEECLRNRTILSPVLVGCLAGAGYGLIDEYDSLRGGTAVGVPVAFIGFWGAIRYGFEALGGRSVNSIALRLRLEKTGRLRLVLVAAGALLAAAALLPPSPAPSPISASIFSWRPRPCSWNSACRRRSNAPAAPAPPLLVYGATFFAVFLLPVVAASLVGRIAYLAPLSRAELIHPKIASPRPVVSTVLEKATRRLCNSPVFAFVIIFA